MPAPLLLCNSRNCLEKLKNRLKNRRFFYSWLTEIDIPSTFSENDKFGLRVYYNGCPSPSSSLYNGNISGMMWGTPNHTSMFYAFTYDGSNRVVNANFNKSGVAANGLDYDPGLWRFHSIDPKATDYYFQSPFAYAVNNPVYFVDKDGKNPAIPLAIAGGLAALPQNNPDYNKNHNGSETSTA